MDLAGGVCLTCPAGYRELVRPYVQCVFLRAQLHQYKGRVETFLFVVFVTGCRGLPEPAGAFLACLSDERDISESGTRSELPLTFQAITVQGCHIGHRPSNQES